MRSGLLNAPVAALRTVAPSTPELPRERIVSSTPLVVVAGAVGAGKSSVVGALLDGPVVACVGGSTPAGAHPVETTPPVSPYLVYRYGERPSARAFIPGHREPRTIELAEPRPGELAAAGPGGQTRPPRRVEVTYPAELLRGVALADTPGTPDLDPAYRDVVLNAPWAGVLFVTSAAAVLSGPELDFLSEAQRRAIPVTFALTGIDRYPEWPAVLAANRDALLDRAPALAGATWSAIDARPESRRHAGPLREAVLRLVAGFATAAPEPPAVAAATVAAHANEHDWREILEREIRARRIGAAQRLAIDLATVHVRCVREIGSGLDCQRLPHGFDRELHALSIRTTHGLDLAAREVARRVFAAILDRDAGANEAVLGRVLAAARRAMDGAASEHIVLVTATSGAAVVSGSGVYASLAAFPAVEPAPDPVLGEIGVGLTAGCYLMWQQKTTSNKRDCRRWLQQAVQVVEVELQRELNQRFADFQEALATVASDTVDHGVLLA
jgi:hypothetical protein